MLRFLGKILGTFDEMVAQAVTQAIMRSFPSGFVADIAETEGVKTMKQVCGCILKAEHKKEKHLWVLTVDYSRCKDRGKD